MQNIVNSKEKKKIEAGHYSKDLCSKILDHSNPFNWSMFIIISWVPFHIKICKPQNMNH